MNKTITIKSNVVGIKKPYLSLYFIFLISLLAIFGCFLPPDNFDCVLKVAVLDKSGGALNSEMMISLTLLPDSGTKGDVREKDLGLLNSDNTVTGISGLAEGNYMLDINLYSGANRTNLLGSSSIPVALDQSSLGFVEVSIDYEPFSDNYILDVSLESELPPPGGTELLTSLNAIFVNYYDRPAGLQSDGFSIEAAINAADADLFEIYYPGNGSIIKDKTELSTAEPSGYSYSDPLVRYQNFDSGITSGTVTYRITDTATGYFEQESITGAADFNVPTNTDTFNFTTSQNTLSNFGLNFSDKIQCYLLIFCDESPTYDSYTGLYKQAISDPANPIVDFMYVSSDYSGIVYIIGIKGESVAKIDNSSDGWPEADLESYLLGGSGQINLLFICNYILQENRDIRALSIYRAPYTVAAP